MKPAEPEVARYAIEFMSVRAFGICATLMSFVANGVYRGLKDTRTPFFAALGSAASNITLNLLFVYGERLREAALCSFDNLCIVTKQLHYLLLLLEDESNVAGRSICFDAILVCLVEQAQLRPSRVVTCCRFVMYKACLAGHSAVAAVTKPRLKCRSLRRDTRSCPAVLNAVLSASRNAGFGWGVFGSGLATTISNWVAASITLGLLIKKGHLRPADMAKLPPAAEVVPMLRAGMLLSIRSIIAFGLVLYASALCVRQGSTMQAGFEVIRQIWIFTIQFFECLNVATQSLCAAYLGAKDRHNAHQVLWRVLFLGFVISSLTGIFVYLGQTPLLHFFTDDAAVIREAMHTLPLICVLFPADAVASAMDGGLLAAQQTGYLSGIQIVGAVVQYGFLAYLAQAGAVTVLTTWATLKLLTFARCLGGAYVNFLSPNSAYRPLPAAAAK